MINERRLRRVLPVLAFFALLHTAPRTDARIPAAGRPVVTGSAGGNRFDVAEATNAWRPGRPLQTR